MNAIHAKVSIGPSLQAAELSGKAILKSACGPSAVAGMAQWHEYTNAMPYLTRTCREFIVSSITDEE
jgi:hypothetical protein